MRRRSEYMSSGKTGIAKATKFIKAIEPHGWECKLSERENGLVVVFARRGEVETLELKWQPPNGAITIAATPIYTLAGVENKVPNAAGCVAIASKPVDMNRLTKTVRKQSKRATKRTITPNVNAIQSLLSDDESLPLPSIADVLAGARNAIPAGAIDDDKALSKYLTGRTVSWVNRVSGKTEMAHVTRVESIKRNGRDQVSFVDKHHTGFRAVYLDSIIGVG